MTLLLYEGILLCEMGRFEPARTAFHEALLLRPDVELPENVAPKVEKEFEVIQKRIAREKSLLLRERMTVSSPLRQESVPLPPSTPRADAPSREVREAEARPATASARDSLLARLLQLRERLLKANGSSTLVPLRELVGIARQIRTAGTEKDLQAAAQSIDAWEQQYAQP
ncbi:hypothetical protein [Cystobacter fuscus]|uniref:hypothetical protein n=1 Tax=Cystobacter fuscus TaxID=43 RepID=UPI0018DF25CC|nr:hypothetical protein [Cystobacter fuscus]